MLAVMLAGGTRFHLANQLVTVVYVDRHLVTKVALAVFLGPARIRVFLMTLRGFPVSRHGALLNELVLFARIALRGCLHQGGVDHLTAARNEPLGKELRLDAVKDLSGAGLADTVLEHPDRGGVGYGARVGQTTEALATHAIKQLKLQLDVGQVVQLLDQQDAKHHLGWIGRSTTLGTVASRRDLVDPCCQQQFLLRVWRPTPGLLFLWGKWRYRAPPSATLSEVSHATSYPSLRDRIENNAEKCWKVWLYVYPVPALKALLLLGVRRVCWLWGSEGWCPEEDLNLHTLRYMDLNHARLPIPPSGLNDYHKLSTEKSQAFAPWSINMCRESNSDMVIIL